MIRITKILGESYDLETGQETRKGLLLTNGISEVPVEASPELIDTVINLMAEERQLMHPASQPEAPVEVAPKPAKQRNGRKKPSPPPQFEADDPGETYDEPEASSI
jgi:hypothetical protein